MHYFFFSGRTNGNMKSECSPVNQSELVTLESGEAVIPMRAFTKRKVRPASPFCGRRFQASLFSLRSTESGDYVEHKSWIHDQVAIIYDHWIQKFK